MVNKHQVQIAAEKRGKVSYSVWEEAKRTGADPEVLRAEEQRWREKYQQELLEYKQYVYNDVGGVVGKGEIKPDVKGTRVDVRNEMAELLRAFVRKNQHLGLEMPDEI